MDTLVQKSQGYGIAVLPLIPGRKEASDKAEMVTQILFGEIYKVLDLGQKWVLIVNSADSYECWIDRKMHTSISEETYTKIVTEKAVYSAETIFRIRSKVGEEGTLIPAGSRLPSFNNGTLQIGEAVLEHTGRTSLSPSRRPSEIALDFLNAPYLWGGKSILGIDCSGFVQVVMSLLGVSLSRDAYQQMEAGETVDFVDSTIEGDLVFFDNSEGRITHVGMVLEAGSIIHASGKVRIDKLDHQGIYNEELGSYTHNTRIIKRVLNL